MKSKISGGDVQNISKEKTRKTAGGKSIYRVSTAMLLLVIFGANMGFGANALSKTAKANQTYSVVAEPKNKRANSKKRNSDIKKIKKQYKERLKKLEERIIELEERIDKLEAKFENADSRKQKGKKVSKKPKDENISDSDWLWPAPGYHNITSGFYDKDNRSHKHGAIDISGDFKSGSIYNASVVASNAGTVTMACTNGYGGGYGNYVVIDHGGGKSTLYAHLNSVSVSKGQEVSKGDVIGKVGSTGAATGAHLHFEYRVDGVRTNPREILNY